MPTTAFMIEVGYSRHFFFFFILSGFSFTDTDNSKDNRGREGIFIYSALPLPPAHEHSDIYVQLCTWDDYHILDAFTLTASFTFTRTKAFKSEDNLSLKLKLVPALSKILHIAFYFIFHKMAMLSAYHPFLLLVLHNIYSLFVV